MAEKEAQEARMKAWVESTVGCPKCQNRFYPERNKASMLGAACIGAAVGGAASAALGAFSGVGNGATSSGVGGVVIGAIIGAWHKEGQVKCPSCGEVFKNPKD